MADTNYNDGIKTLSDEYDVAYSSWVNNPDLKDEAHAAALRRGDEAALSILETPGPAAMPSPVLKKDFEEKVAAAQEERKHPAVKEAEKALADFEARAQSAGLARALLRSNLINRIRSRKGPGA